jgi:hypothetical protein
MTQQLDETPQVVSFAPRSPWEAISTPASPSLPLEFLPTGSDPLSVDVQLAPEVEVGNVEYKLKLPSPTVRCMPSCSSQRFPRNNRYAMRSQNDLRA